MVHFGSRQTSLQAGDCNCMRSGEVDFDMHAISAMLMIIIPNSVESRGESDSDMRFRHALDCKRQVPRHF